LLGLLLESELPLPTALQLAADGSRDPEIAEACRTMILNTEMGQPLSHAVAARRQFPAELAQIIGWGEGVQTLPEAMYMAGEMFEGRAKLHTTFVAAAVSPVAFVLLIFGLGITVVALFAPLFKLVTELSG
jgi:type II secretory pathway component PulF